MPGVHPHVFLKNFFFQGNVADSFSWASLLPWGYATRKVHREPHKAVLPYSFINIHFQFWEKMEIIFFSYIPNMALFFPSEQEPAKKSFVNLLTNLHFRTSEMFFSSHLYLPFKIFDVFIMVFSSQSSSRNRAWYFFQVLPVAMRTLPIEIHFLNDTEKQDKQWVEL